MWPFRRSPDWREVVFWALDLETTGLDPKSAVPLSIGMVPIREGVVRWGERHYTLLRPPHRDLAATEAVSVHELLPSELDDAPELADLLPELEARLRGAALLVHWQALDVGVLKRAFREAGRPWPKPAIVDTARLIAMLDQRRNIVEPEPEPTPTQLSAARSAFGLPRHEEHHALYDALATAELFLMLRQRLRLERLRSMT